MPKIPMKAARIAAGFTQEQLAEKMGVDRSTIISWESGKRDIKPANFYYFCKLTGFEAEDIFLPSEST